MSRNGDNMEEIKVSIRGKNNERISDSIVDISIGEHKFSEDKNITDTNYSEIVKFICENKTEITEAFLEQSQGKNLIINAADGSNKKNDHKLWTPDYNGSSYYGEVVGVIKHKLKYSLGEESDKKIELNIKLQIQSRFDGEKPYFLATMLLRNNLSLSDGMVPADEEHLYDYMLLLWYKSMLREAYVKGFFRTYRRFQENNDRVKGSIEISRHVKLNIGQNNGKIAYSYRENTVNNYLNHLIVLAYDYMKKKYPELVEQNFDNDIDTKQIIGGLKSEIGYSPIDSRSIIEKNNRPISHPYFTEYEDLRIICIKILRDEGISIWNAEGEDTKSILFYIPDLWELYLEDCMKEQLSHSFHTQEEIKVFGDKTKNKFKKSTYPDFVFVDHEDKKDIPYMVIDAKFRKGWELSLSENENGSGNISDLHDYDKCIRDMNSINAHATGIIYPTLSKPNGEYYCDDSICHKISEYNINDIFYTFPIWVPPIDSGYMDWKERLINNVSSAMSVMNVKISNEKEYESKVREKIRNIMGRSWK